MAWFDHTRDGSDVTHSNYCDMMFEIKNMKIVINNCQLLSTTVNNTKCPRKRCQQQLIAVNNSQQVLIPT